MRSCFLLEALFRRECDDLLPRDLLGLGGLGHLPVPNEEERAAGRCWFPRYSGQKSQRVREFKRPNGRNVLIKKEKS